MKLNRYHIHARAADMGTVDQAAGLSMNALAAPKKSTLSNAVADAIAFRFPSRFLIPLLSCAVPGMVFASPEGGQVVAGSASITNPDANTTLITQITARTAIDWQRFNIGAQEYVQFAQPDASSVALNRVIGGDPSQILGNLSANGQVFLVNPNGVYFGQGATVDVGGLVASVRDISTENFMSGNYVFSKTSGAPDDVGVVNDGVITARDGGYVVMMGDYVHNTGIIRARLGTVTLAAGNSIIMDVKGNGLVSVAIEKETLSKLAGVNNAGQIMADGGRVMMTAKVANDLIDTAINNEGLVVANSIAERNGVIFLTAVGGDVVNSGTLDASAETGSNVGGGGVLVYSDRDVINAAGAKIRATGDGRGDGGTVRVIAANNLEHQVGASIDVSGAAGQGGFVEVSGHGGLSIKGVVELGSGGSLLIDPAVLNINSGSSSPGVSTASIYFVGRGFIENKLNANNNVTLVASNTIAASSTFTITATGTGDLAIKIGTVGGTGGTLGASTSTVGGFDCAFDGFCLAGGGTSGFYNFTPDPTGSINLSTVAFNLAGGLNIAGGTASGNVSVGGISASGNVTITAGTDINIQGNVSGAGTSFKASAGNDISLNGGIAAFGNALNAKVTLNANNNVNINSDVFLANNSLILAADKDNNLIGDVNIKGVAGTKKTVFTQGDLNVSGKNFNVTGASLSFVAADSQLNVLANNINVNVSAGMNVVGGKYVPVSVASTGAVQVGTTIKANNNITINAASLTVSGGTVNASPSFGSGTAVGLTVDANASLEAGANLVATLSGSLNVSGGAANANAGGSSGGSMSTFTATANANAALLAAGNVNITANTVNLNKGTENAVAIYGGIANASASSKMQGNNVTLNVASAMNANSASVSAINDVNITAGTYIENINNSIVAGNNLSVSVGGNYAVNGVYSAANLLSLSAAGTLDLNAVLGSATTPLNNAVTLSAANNVNINQDVYLANKTLTLNADSDVNGTGDVNIKGTIGISKTVLTQGDLNVSGKNFSVTGGTVSSTGAAQVNVQANNIDVSVTGNMVVNGGNFTQMTLIGGGTAKIDTVVTANNNMTINAASLTVSGGAASPSASGSTLVIDANASLVVGGNLTVNLTGALNVSGGVARAGTNGIVNANAIVSAGGFINVIANTVTLQRGVANSGGVATASASSKIQGNNVTLNVASAMKANSALVSAINDVNITAGTYIENISNSIVAGNNLSVSVGGNYAVNGVYSAANLLSLSAAGTLDLNTVLGSALTPFNSKVTLSAGNHLRLNNDIYLANQTLTLAADTNANGSGDVNIVGSASLPVNVSTLGDMIVSGVGLNVADASVTAGTLRAEMNGTIEGLNASFNAGGLYMSAAGNINLSTSTVNVGSGTVAGINGDAAVLAVLAKKGIPLPSTPNPNAKFVAGGMLNLGTIAMSGNVPYLWMVADTTNIQGLNIPGSIDVVVQYSPFTVSKSIGVEDVLDTSELVNYNNLQHFGILPGTTIIIGSSSQAGDINIGNLGKINIGSKNIVFVTSARIATIDNIISSGVVAELLVGQFNGQFDGQLILDKDGEEFVAPILTEVEVALVPSDDPVKEKGKRKNLIKDDEEKILMCEAG